MARFKMSEFADAKEAQFAAAESATNFNRKSLLKEIISVAGSESHDKSEVLESVLTHSAGALPSESAKVNLKNENEQIEANFKWLLDKGYMEESEGKVSVTPEGMEWAEEE